MPRDEGGGLQSAAIRFAEDEEGNLILLLGDFPPQVRGAVRALLVHAFEQGLVTLNAEMTQIRQSGGGGLAFPVNLKGQD